MRTALLIADLEGVAGVDTLEALAFGGIGHADARERMTQEVNAAIEGLLTQGFERVRVSDSHRSGSGASNLLTLHPVAELRVADPDSYGGPLLDGVEAIACLGMHAAGGTAGFAAHTVEVHSAWLLQGRPISETEIAFWLAADLGIRAVFASGDDVLGGFVDTLAPYVVTKHSIGIDATTSTSALAAIRAAAASRPRSLPHAPDGPIRLRFKTPRTAAFDCEVPGESFTDRYLAALKIVVSTEAELLDELGGSPAKVAQLLSRPFPGTHP